MWTTTAKSEAKAAPADADAGFRLGSWTVDPVAGELTRGDACAEGGETVRLEPKVMTVLLELVRRPGEVVGKEELLAAVWPDVTVTEDAVWRSIATLRRVLGDDPRRPRYIETLPRRGYRLKASVERGAAEPGSVEQGSVEQGRGAPPAPPSALRVVPPPNADSPPPPLARSGQHRRALSRTAAAAVLAAAVLLFVLAVKEAKNPAAPATPAPRPAPEAAADPTAADQTPADPTPADETPAPEIADLVRAAEAYATRRDPRDLARAAVLYRQALAAAPDDAGALAGLANVYARQTMERGGAPALLAAARRTAQRAVELAPQSADAHKALGSVDHVDGRFAAAAASYRRALELDPSHDSATFNLAGVYVDSGELDRGLDLLRSLPPSPVPEARALHLAALAEIRYLLYQDDAARQLLEQALTLAPGSLAAGVVAARLELAAGRPAAARDRLREVAQLHPDSALGTYWTARAEIAAGQPEAARRRLTAAVAAGGQRGLQVAGLLAHLAAAAGDAESARRTAAPLLAVGADSETWYLHQHAAEAAAAVGERQGAFERLRRAVSRGLLDVRDVAADPALTALAGDPELRRLLDDMDSRVRVLRRRLGLAPLQPVSALVRTR